MKILNIMCIAGVIMVLTVVAIMPKSLPEEYCKEIVFEFPVEKGESFGVVSYYGEKWDGRTTANMEIYNCLLLTCASPVLPFNTILEITNLENNKSVIVRVNDRGPYKMHPDGKVIKPLKPHPIRKLDLSKASFKAIGALNKGLLNVKYKVVGIE
jgi:rare lipoprotein A